MKVMLKPGDTLIVELEDADGQFQIRYGTTSLDVIADLPDQSGRVGVIYSEPFGIYSLDHETEIALRDESVETIYCEQQKQPGGCQLPNPHCGWPDCNKPK